MLARVKSEEVNFSRIVISSELSCCEVNFITHSPNNNLLSFIFCYQYSYLCLSRLSVI